MKLLIDVGNSRLKWAVCQPGVWQVGAPVEHQRADWLDDLAATWAALHPEQIWLASVADPALTTRLSDWLTTRFNRPVQRAQSMAQAHGVQSGYREPQRLGVDRWLALLALRQHYALPACVLDVGTAATFDLLDADGVHQGGAIAPGLRLMARALRSQTAQIQVEADGEGADLGDHTAAAIQCGALNALVGMAERLRAAAADHGRLPTAVLTGGDAAYLAPYLGQDWVYQADLVLQGLAIVAGSES